MSPYIEAGYSVALVSLAVYAATLVRREQLARRRLRRAPVWTDSKPSAGGASGGEQRR